VSCWDRLIYGKGKTTKEKKKSLATPPYPHTHIFRTNEDMGHICTTFPPPRRTISTPYLACNSITSPTFPIQSCIPTHQPGPKLTHLAYRQHFRSASYMLHLHMHDSTFNVKKKEKVLHVIFPDVAYAGTRCTGWCYWVQGSGRCPSVESG
jgi:hypothetical protein